MAEPHKCERSTSTANSGPTSPSCCCVVLPPPHIGRAFCRQGQGNQGLGLPPPSADHMPGQRATSALTHQCSAPRATCPAIRGGGEGGHRVVWQSERALQPVPASPPFPPPVKDWPAASSAPWILIRSASRLFLVPAGETCTHRTEHESAAHVSAATTAARKDVSVAGEAP